MQRLFVSQQLYEVDSLKEVLEQAGILCRINPVAARKMEAVGLLVRRDDRYLMHLIYRNGMLDVNGWLHQPSEVVPMAMLVFGAMKL